MTVGHVPLTAIVNTFNQRATVADAIAGALRYPGTREVIVVDDGSTDATWETVQELAPQHQSVAWQLFRMPRRGGVYCRRHGLERAGHRLCLLLGGDFIIRDVTAIETMVRAHEEGVAFVSIYGPHGGMGTVYDRNAVATVGGFALAFNRFGSGYRDDSELYYRLTAHGYRGLFLPHLRHAYNHLQQLPYGVLRVLRYVFHRVAVHELDVLLFKLHPGAFTRDFDVRFGLIVNPRKDYERATGRWKPGQPFALSSPQGVVLVSGSTKTRRLLVRTGGVLYALALVAVRAKGSLRYRKFLL